MSDLYVINTENFEIFIESSLLPEKEYIADTLEKEFKYISELFCFKKNSNIKVFITDSINTGGANADPLKSDININYFVDHASFLDFSEVVRHELVHVVQFHQIGQGSGGLRYLLRLGEIPLWFYEGYAESFSRNPNPYWYVFSYIYPLYTRIELQTFYFRDNFNRSGGYFSSFELIEYLRDLFKDEYVTTFLCNKKLKSNFKKAFRERFGNISDLISESRSYMKNRASVNYPNSFSVFKESHVNLSSSSMTEKGLYYICTDNEGNKTLKFNDRDILKKVHSYSVYDDNNIVASFYFKGKYRIIKIVDNKQTFTDIYGIYPNISGDKMSFMDNRGYINVVKDNNIIFKEKAYAGIIRDNVLYYIDKDENLCFYYFSGKFKRQVLKLENYYPEISFYNGNPVILEYIDGVFCASEVKDDKRKKLFSGYATQLNFYKEAVYFTGLSNTKKVIFKRELPK